MRSKCCRSGDSHRLFVQSRRDVPLSRDRDGLAWQQATDTPLNIEEQIALLLILLLTSKGAAGVAGAAFVVLAATLSAHGTIPVASVALVLGIHRLMSKG